MKQSVSGKYGLKKWNNENARIKFKHFMTLNKTFKWERHANSVKNYKNVPKQKI